MASRTFNNQSLALEEEWVTLWAEVAIGGSGAPTITRAKGITSITRTGAGEYDVVTDDKYPGMLKCSGNIERATAVDLAIHPTGRDLANKTISIGVVDFDTPAFTDPSSGDVMFLEIVLRNRSN